MTPKKSITPRQMLDEKFNDKVKTQKVIDEINKGIGLNQKDYISHIDKVLSKHKIEDPALTETIARQVRPFS